jgi:isopentenyldiphosphate isomerase
MEEVVDILTPPTFEKSGVTKPRSQAWTDGDWIGTFNLWILNKTPTPSIVYQVRSPNSSWAPNKFDVTAGGHYTAGESLFDGLREIDEELGITYQPDQLTYLGRKMHVSPDVNGLIRKNIVDISFIADDRPLTSYQLEKAEVYAVSTLPIHELIKVHTQDGYEFSAELFTTDKKTQQVLVNKNSFPYNWDNYHHKIALLADRFLNGEKDLIY